VPRVLSIGAPGNGSGKTRLAVTLLEAFPGAFTAVKFTTVYRDGQNCPKTETACACRELHGLYTIISDPAIIEQPDTDTGRLAGAGAARTLWALALPQAHRRLWDHLTSEVLRPDERVISEGNRIIPALSPEALVIVIGPDVPRSRWKADTWDLVGRADLVVINAHGPSAGPAAAGSLDPEIRDRTRAPVVVQDVTVPLAGWSDGTLLRLASGLLDPAALPRSPHPASL